MIAPVAPDFGINTKFKIALAITPTRNANIYSLSFPHGSRYWLRITSPIHHIGKLIDSPIMNLEHTEKSSPQKNGANSFAIADIPNINANDMINDTFIDVANVVLTCSLSPSA